MNTRTIPAELKNGSNYGLRLGDVFTRYRHAKK